MLRQNTNMQVSRGHRLVATFFLSAAILVANPLPAHAMGLVEAVGGIFSFLTGSKFPASSLAGLGLQIKGEARLADTGSLNGARDVNAELAGDIARKKTYPSDYDGCSMSKSSSAGQASSSDADTDSTVRSIGAANRPRGVNPAGEFGAWRKKQRMLLCTKNEKTLYGGCE